MKYRTYLKVSGQLTDQQPEQTESFIKQHINFQIKKLLKQSLKALKLQQIHFGEDGLDFMKNRITVIHEMDVYKIPHILNPLHRRPSSY